MSQIEVYKKDNPSYFISADEVMNNENLIEDVIKWIRNNETLSPLIYSSADPKIVTEKQIQYGQEVLAVVNGLGLQELKIGKEIAYGVPALWSPNSNCNKPVSVTLKSGNFGQTDFFKRALQILRGKT